MFNLCRCVFPYKGTEINLHVKSAFKCQKGPWRIVESGDIVGDYMQPSHMGMHAEHL